MLRRMEPVSTLPAGLRRLAMLDDLGGCSPRVKRVVDERLGEGEVDPLDCADAPILRVVDPNG